MDGATHVFSKLMLLCMLGNMQIANRCVYDKLTSYACSCMIPISVSKRNYAFKTKTAILQIQRETVPKAIFLHIKCPCLRLNSESLLVF